MALLQRLFRRAAPGSGEAPPEAAPPAWRLLDATWGVQQGEYPDAARAEIQPLLEHAPLRVLDIGCATGAVGAALKQSFGCWVWGCELDPAAARRAAERLDRVSVRPSSEWDAEEVALLGTVDTVLLLDVLEHMYNPWQQMEFLAEHLPAGAQVIVSLPNVGNLRIVRDLAQGRFEYGREGILDVTHVRFFTPESMQAMFEQTGFRIERRGVLTSTVTDVEPREFPVRVELGGFSLDVRSPEHWLELNAAQLGFRLRVA